MPGKPNEKGPVRDVRAFLSRVRSVLYRSSKSDYKRWERLVEEFKTDGGMKANEAAIQAAKDFPVCRKLFRAYSGVIEKDDPHPESHPGLTSGSFIGQPEGETGMECEERKQSYREDLDWAIEAAGKLRNTGEVPEVCPNYTAFYLYQEARDNPKEFLAKFTQVVNRGNDELEDQRRSRKSGERVVSEIEEMLSTLEEIENKGETK